MSPRHDTRHKEYSLIPALAVGVLLFFTGSTYNFPLLVVLNVLAVASILYSAFSVVRHADVLAHRFGEPYGSLVLTLAIVVLETSLISILMLSGSAGETLMRDTVYSVVIIVLAGLVGIALLLGGRKYKSQYFNFSGVKHFLISIIPLSVIVFVLPYVLPGKTFTTGQLFIVGAVCLVLYVYFLIIQTKTHTRLFIYDDEDEEGDDHHGKPSSHSTAWHAVLLIIHLIAVIAVTKLNSYPLEHLFERLNAPKAFTGFLVALLILTPEGLGAVSSILHNQVQRAMNLLLGSVLATLSLTVPAVILIATLTNQKLIFALDLPDIILMITTFMICQLSLTAGKTNAHSGAAHIVMFVIYIMLLF